MTKTKFLSWAGKLLLVAVPAAISGYASYMKSKVESQDSNKASYETLQKAFVDSEETDDRDDTVVNQRLAALEARVALCEEKTPRVYRTAPIIFSSTDAGITVEMGELERGREGGRPFLPTRSAFKRPPEKFEDALEQFKAKK